MPLQEVVTPWDQQPQELVEVDWSGIAPPDIGVWMPPTGMRNAVTGAPVTIVGAGAQQAAGVGGTGFEVSGNSLPGSSAGNLDTGVLENPTQLWFVVRFVSFDAASGSGYGSPFHRDQYAINWHHVNAAYRGAVSLNGGGAYPKVALLDTSANKLHTVVASWDGATLSVWQNGSHCGSVPASGSLGSNPAALRLLASSSGASWNGQIFLAAMGRRAISSSAAAALSANPWQLFQRREWVPMAAGSGGGVTGASSGTLELSGSAAGSVRVSGASAGTLAISGTSAAAVRVTGASTGALSLSGTATGTVGATGVTGQSSQTLSLTGTSTATVRVSGQSAQTLALSGTAAGSARVSGASAGTLSLTGTATATTTGAVAGASNGVLSLSGSATGTVRVSGGSAAVLQITGSAGAQIVVRGVSAGVLTMTGSATGTTGGAEPEPTAALAKYTITARSRKTAIRAKARCMEIKA